MFIKNFRASSGVKAIICGLGNPGPKFAGTRHNAGFMSVDALAAALGARVDRSRFKAFTAEAKLGSTGVLLMKPQTFMNLSGQAVKQAASFFKIAPDKIFVVFDDVSLPVGKMRIRGKGSAGGHNGIKSIIAELGTEEFPRLKLGVGEPQFPDLADWVLSRFTPDEQRVMAKVYGASADALRSMVLDGFTEAANKYNGFDA